MMTRFTMFLSDFAQRTRYLFVWISRMGHCRGFGIQSPTDFRFVNEVINEHWPYYAYQDLGDGLSWEKRRLGQLYLRLANWAQPLAVVDDVGMMQYLRAGCRQCTAAGDADPVDMAVLSLSHGIGENREDLEKILSRCHANTVLVVEDIQNEKERWKKLWDIPQITITFDLYYCGILLFDPKRYRQYYKINF